MIGAGAVSLYLVLINRRTSFVNAQYLSQLRQSLRMSQTGLGSTASCSLHEAVVYMHLYGTPAEFHIAIVIRVLFFVNSCSLLVRRYSQ